MIKNERQYLITKALAKKFKEAIEAFDNKKTDTPPLLAKAQREALESQLDELKWHLDEYEKLRSVKLKRLKKSSFQEGTTAPGCQRYDRYVHLWLSHSHIAIGDVGSKLH